MTTDQQLAERLRDQATELSRTTARRHLERFPALEQRFGPLAEQRCREDGVSHLQHLAATLATGRPGILDEYLVWVSGLLATYDVDRDDLVRHLDVLVEVVEESLGPDAGARVGTLLGAGLAQLADRDLEPATFLDPDTPGGALAEGLLATLLDGDRRGAITMVLDASAEGMSVESLYLDVFAPCLREVGRLWQLGRASVAQEHLVTASIQLAMAQVYPQTLDTPRVGRRLVVSSVGGELHEIGGRMLADLFELYGWDTTFLGANTPDRDVARTVVRVDADVVALSATLPTQIETVRGLVRAIREAHHARVLVGGRPFIQLPGLWRTLGADGTAVDARHAVRIATDLVHAT